jgi:hypothetical protein
MSLFEVRNPDAPEIYAAWRWGDNVYHWMFDILPALLYLRHHDPKQLIKPVAIQEVTLRYKHVQSWIKLLNIAPTPTPGAFDDAAFRREEVNRVTVLWPFRYAGLAEPEAVHWLREFSKPDPDSDQFVLIQRNVQGAAPNTSRNLENRDEIIAHFHKRGVPLAMHFLEGYSLDRQIRLFSNAKLVIGAHGAGMSNVVFCEPGTRVIEIRAPFFYNGTVASIAQALPLNYSSHFGRERHGCTDLYRHCLHCEPETLFQLACGDP